MNEFEMSKLRAPKNEEIKNTNDKTNIPNVPLNTAPVQVEIVHTDPLRSGVQGIYVWLIGAWILKTSFKGLHKNHPKVPLISYRDACFGLLALGTVSENMRPTLHWVDKKKS